MNPGRVDAIKNAIYLVGRIPCSGCAGIAIGNLITGSQAIHADCKKLEGLEELNNLLPPEKEGV